MLHMQWPVQNDRRDCVKGGLQSDLTSFYFLISFTWLNFLWLHCIPMPSRISAVEACIYFWVPSICSPCWRLYCVSGLVLQIQNPTMIMPTSSSIKIETTFTIKLRPFWTYKIFKEDFSIQLKNKMILIGFSSDPLISVLSRLWSTLVSGLLRDSSDRALTHWK